MRQVSSATAGALAALALGVFCSAPSHAAELQLAFDGGRGSALDSAAAPRWTRVLHRASTDMAVGAQQECGAEAPDKPGKPARTGPVVRKATAEDCRLADWTRKLAMADGLSPRKRMAWVHRTINALPYVSDRENWGVADYWESPAEMFARGGDCEGFALTKYFSLRAAGFSDESMRVAVVWDVVDQEEHAILLVRLDGETWFLDNKMAEPERVNDHAGRYRLIYYLNESGVHLPQAPSLFQRTAAPRTRLTDGGRTLVLQVRPRSPSRLLGHPATGPVLSAVDNVMPAGR